MRWIWIDRFVEFHRGKSARAVKCLSLAEDYFADHFPGYPVMPATLILEGLAQTGGVLIFRDLPDRKQKLIYFTGIEDARFRRPVVPGDQLRLEMQSVNRRKDFGKMHGKATVDGKLAAEATLLFAIVSRPGT